jgi:hypothetical protein
MKANEAPKSKFVYPDKLYARTNNNITLDISYAPQTLEAVEYTRTDAFIEKASKWIIDNFPTVSGISALMYADDFKNYMKGE